MVKVYELSNEPNLSIAALRLLSTPTSYQNYRFSEKSAPGHFFVGVFRQDDMSIFVVIVGVFIRVFDFVGIMRHSNFNEIL